jgi:hypothetical protein
MDPSEIAIAKAIAEAKSDLIHDVASGAVPADVASIAELDSHVDADEYGSRTLIKAFPSAADRWAALQIVLGAVDEWIKAGELRPKVYARTFKAKPGIELPQWLSDLGFEDHSWGNDATALAVRELAPGRWLGVWCAEEREHEREYGVARFAVGICEGEEMDPQTIAENVFCDTESPDEARRAIESRIKGGN